MFVCSSGFPHFFSLCRNKNFLQILSALILTCSRINISWLIRFLSSGLFRKSFMATETNTEEQVTSETSWISVSPSGLWEVHRRWKGERKRGDNTPLLGSVCKIKVCLKNHTKDINTQPLSSNDTESAVSVSSVQVTEHPRSQDSVLQVPLDRWMVLRVGEGQCDVIEGCLEGMRAGETCEVSVRLQLGSLCD